jgi:23S rRNA-/tRNA-specific pseudouridylate synthase
MEAGVILFNGLSTNGNTIIKEHDEILHTVHRHEPPVNNINFNFIYSDPDIIVIDKPCSIPVHASGRYRFNSLLYILAKEHNLNNLYLVHRLDRLTSGVLLLARNKGVASKYASHIKEGSIQKHYLAKVKGQFPEGYSIFNYNITFKDYRL